MDFKLRDCFICIPQTLFFAAVSLFAACSNSSGDEKTLDRLMHEAPIGWKKIIEFYDGTCFDVTTIRANSTVQPPVQKIFVRDSKVRTEIAAKLPDGRNIQSVELFNSEYQAEAMDMGDGGFRIGKVGPRISIPESTGNGYIYRNAIPGLTVQGTFLPEHLIGFPEFDVSRSWGYKVIDANSKTDDQGNELVVVTLKYCTRDASGSFVVVSAATKEQVFASKNCFVILSPHRNWSAIEFRDEHERYFETAEAGEEVHRLFKSCQISYDIHLFHPFQKKEGHGSIVSKANGGNAVYEYSMPSKPEIQLADSFFRLSSLGLPEPTHLLPRRNYFWTWILGGLGSLIAVRLTILHLRRRH